MASWTEQEGYTQLVKLPGGEILVSDQSQGLFFVARLSGGKRKVSLQDAVRLYRDHRANEENLLWKRPPKARPPGRVKNDLDAADWRADLRAKLGYPDEEA